MASHAQVGGVGTEVCEWSCSWHGFVFWWLYMWSERYYKLVHDRYRRRCAMLDHTTRKGALPLHCLSLPLVICFLPLPSLPHPLHRCLIGSLSLLSLHNFAQCF